RPDGPGFARQDSVGTGGDNRLQLGLQGRRAAFRGCCAGRARRQGRASCRAPTKTGSTPVSRRSAIVSLVFAAAACTVGPDYEPASIALGEQWLGATDTAEVDTAWWTRFNDPLLSELVASAMMGNK